MYILRTRSKNVFYRTALIVSLIVLFQSNCLAAGLSREQIIEKYSPAAEKIIAALKGDSTAWKRTAYICDHFGARLSGSKVLEDMLDWGFGKMKADGLERVAKEPVMVPHWDRGNEYLEMVSPRKMRLPVTVLGGSINTPNGPITAPCYVVGGIEDLERNPAPAKGKIVVFNIKFENYGQAIKYRYHGAVIAARFGAVASLTRSATPAEIYQAHSGSMGYVDSVPKIPHGAITPEDAAMLGRIQADGENIFLSFYTESKFLPDSPSSNLVGEITGSKFPDEVIAVGGHSDSWDNTRGAHDDASGCVAGWQIVKLLHDLGLRPARTIRSVFWANEENGNRGGIEYARAHKNEKHIYACEFDGGIFAPYSINFSGPDSLMENQLKPLEGILSKYFGSIQINKGGGGVDIGPLMRNNGVPGMSPGWDTTGKYFWYHHSPNDTPEKINSDDFNNQVAAMAITLYILANEY